MTLLTEPPELFIASLRAMTRICWGQPDRLIFAMNVLLLLCMFVDSLLACSVYVCANVNRVE